MRHCGPDPTPHFQLTWLPRQASLLGLLFSTPTIPALPSLSPSQALSPLLTHFSYGSPVLIPFHLPILHHFLVKPVFCYVLSANGLQVPYSAPVPLLCKCLPLGYPALGKLTKGEEDLEEETKLKRVPESTLRIALREGLGERK
uniref:Uncharacterized protein n=1 Tax=Pipistrellus kuhlii TaxID=59472 RepID=A0A7J7YXH0_PIPKU|nr:hypothetical protein mPipKuh1_009921 [Pipistrellus kuhlii]